MVSQLILAGQHQLSILTYLLILILILDKVIDKCLGMPIVQVISTCPLDSINIEKAGADRIQLVSALQIGGLTPSAAIVRKSLQCVDIPTMIMIRHHNNGFVHAESEVSLFVTQVNQCIQMGVKGLVFGGITQNGQIDCNLIERIKSQTNLNKINVTFHKAFDQVKDIVKAYQTLNHYQIDRVLTQGGKLPILDNWKQLGKIVQMSKNQNKTKVLLGGGINLENVVQILHKTNTQQVHIGTCVRKNKYGPVLQQKVSQFVNLIKK